MLQHLQEKIFKFNPPKFIPKDIPIKFCKINPNAVLPTQGTIYAACTDLYITDIIQRNTWLVEVYYGFKTEIPTGYKAVIVPRSSFTGKSWVMQNSPGQIDSDYRGEWKSVFQAIPIHTNTFSNFVFSVFPYSVGDRVTQVYFEEVKPVKWIEVENEDELSDTQRGSGGFGSTGK